MLVVVEFHEDFVNDFGSHLFVTEDNDEDDVHFVPPSKMGLLLPELDAESGLEDGRDEGEKGLAVVTANDFDTDLKFSVGTDDVEEGELKSDVLKFSFLCAAACSDEFRDDKEIFVDDFILDNTEVSL